MIGAETTFAEEIITRATFDEVAALGVKSSDGNHWRFSASAAETSHPFKSHRLVGLGPIHSQSPGSSSLDCVLVTALLLGLNRRDFHLEGSVWGQDFVDLLAHFWGPQNGLELRSSAMEAAGEVKSYFWAKYRHHFDLGNINYISAAQMWSRVTALAPKLSTTQVIRLECPTCKATRERRRNTSSYELTTSMFVNGRDLLSARIALGPMVSRVTTNARCEQCKVALTAQRLWPDGPPAIISVGLPKGMRIAEGTGCARPFEVEYHWQSKISGKVQTSAVPYRWLGGIYVKEKRFRVYFYQPPLFYERDRPEDVGKMMFYDGRELRGAIIGNVAPQRPGEIIPEAWQNPTVLLFKRLD